MRSPKQNPDSPESQVIKPATNRRVILGTSILAMCIVLSLMAYSVAFRDEPAPPQVGESIEGFDEQPESVVASEAKSQTEPDVLSDGFVGSQACADCHREIAETYAKHPMARTMATVAQASPIEVCEGDAATFEAFGCQYRVERIGDRMVHTEYVTDDAGEIVYEQSVDVDYAVGSGTTARTYLINRGGILVESPITWYDNQQKWDLSPGYEDNPRQRFNRRVSDGCVQCHSGRVAVVGDGTANRYAEEPFLEQGIGCERCHGAGREHVKRMEGDGEFADDLAIVNPARLAALQAEAVCYQCHRDGKGRILRKGKSYHDFRPGMATEDVWTVFASNEPFSNEGANPFTSQVQQMESSACFLGSEGELRCTSCHDPHHAPEPDERAEYYRERCNNCHADRGCSLPSEEREPPPARNSCIHCHMSSSGSQDIPHASQSDHRVLRSPTNTSTNDDHTDARSVWTVFDESNERLPAWELRRARALAMSDQSIREHDRQLTMEAIRELEEALAHDSNDADVLRSLAFLNGFVGQRTIAVRLLKKALTINPEDELALKNLGLMAYRARSFGSALNCYESFLGINKWDATIYGPYVGTLAATGDVQAALQAAEYGLQLDPSERELRRMTAQLYQKTGNQQKSREHLQKLKVISERLDPWDQKRRERIHKEVEKNLQQGESQP